MSSVPPPPPGGYPPYDPHTQWRIYREQQKAAWRAQRDAWRAQRHMWRANYVGAYGPRVPSVVGPVILIAIGIIWLLIYSGHIAADKFWTWYGHWWPMLLILAGLALLGEWALDVRRATPVRRSGGFIGLLILLAFLGLCAAGWNHMGNVVGPWNWNRDNGEFFNMFGLPEHDTDQPAISQAVPSGATIDIENPQGDVSVTAGAGSTVEVEAHEVAYADSDSSAQKIFNAEKAAVKVSGSTVLVQSGNKDHGRVNMTVTVPATAHVTVNAWDNVTAAGLGAGIDITARGDVHLNSIGGPVVAHFVRGRHDVFAAHGVQGDLTLEGDVNDITLSDIKGAIAQNGDIPGDVSMENVAGPVHLHTSVTTVDAAELPGDLTLNDDDLRITGAKGQVRVTTHSKDVDLSQIYGDSYVENRDGTISIEPAGPYGIEARNAKGDVEVTLPPNASATVNGRSHNGDIVTDFGLTVTGDEDKTVAGRIGAGSARMVLNADNGDLRIKKGSAFPSAPPSPQANQSPAAAAAPNARHLKTSKALPTQPVTQ